MGAVLFVLESTPVGWDCAGAYRRPSESIQEEIDSHEVEVIHCEIKEAKMIVRVRGIWGGKETRETQVIRPGGVELQ